MSLPSADEISVRLLLPGWLVVCGKIPVETPLLPDKARRRAYPPRRGDSVDDGRPMIATPLAGPLAVGTGERVAGNR